MWVSRSLLAENERDGAQRNLWTSLGGVSATAPALLYLLHPCSRARVQNVQPFAGNCSCISGIQAIHGLWRSSQGPIGREPIRTPQAPAERAAGTLLVNLVALVKKNNAADGRFGRALQRFPISALMFFDKPPVCLDRQGCWKCRFCRSKNLSKHCLDLEKR